MFYVTPNEQHQERVEKGGYTVGSQYYVLAIDFQQDRNPRLLVPNDDGVIKASSAEQWIYDGQKAGRKPKE